MSFESCAKSSTKPKNRTLGDRMTKTHAPLSTGSTSVTVAFRIPTEIHQVLQERAAAVGMSPGEFSRRLVLDALDGRTCSAGVQAEITEMKSQIGNLQTAFLKATEGLLVAAGRTKPKDAELWVRDNVASHL